MDITDDVVIVEKLEVDDKEKVIPLAVETEDIKPADIVVVEEDEKVEIVEKKDDPILEPMEVAEVIKIDDIKPEDVDTKVDVVVEENESSKVAAVVPEVPVVDAVVTTTESDPKPKPEEVTKES